MEELFKEFTPNQQMYWRPIIACLTKTGLGKWRKRGEVWKMHVSKAVASTKMKEGGGGGGGGGEGGGESSGRGCTEKEKKARRSNCTRFNAALAFEKVRTNQGTWHHIKCPCKIERGDREEMCAFIANHNDSYLVAMRRTSKPRSIYLLYACPTSVVA